MNELESARMLKRVVRMACVGVITVTSNTLWGTTVAWLALAISMIIVVGLIGIEQEVRRFSDALMRAEQRATGEPP